MLCASSGANVTIQTTTSSISVPLPAAMTASSADDLRYQDAILRDVSRTFALTIPQLPDRLRVVVGNAYLLCRIADTIEDSPALTIEQKLAFSQAFAEIVEGSRAVGDFGDALAYALTQGSLEAERDLIRNTARVIRITHGFSDAERAALSRCVRHGRVSGRAVHGRLARRAAT
jgi:farnesyl-diphosphate farnesyltransferase